MKAWTYERYGGPDVLQLADLPDPVPGERDVVVRVRATTVTAGDWRGRSLDLPRGFGPFGRLVFGLRRPRKPVLGLELAGVVESVGARVTAWRPGDEVFGQTGGRMGAHAELCVLPEKAPLARKPARLTFAEAAALPFGASTALHFLQKGEVKAGERVLVIGASGNVGTMLVQLARHRGAEVTGVTSARNAELVRGLGASHVLDYAREDALAAREAYDVIADTVGDTRFAAARPALRPGGRFLAIAGDLATLLAPMAGQREGKRIVAGVAPETREDLEEMIRLVDAGALRPVIDRTFRFDEMREAHALVDSRRKRGSVVVTLP